MSETLCLQWNEFKENVTSAFEDLRTCGDFSDVTLACSDGETLEAHKMVLAASSPVFQNILRQNKHPHPVIFLRGVKSGDLLPILDFLYKGEARVLSENLESFLAIADELKMKGLAGKRNCEFLERENITNAEEIKENESIERNPSLESSMNELPGQETTVIVPGQRSRGYLEGEPDKKIGENEAGEENTLHDALDESYDSNAHLNETNNRTPSTPAPKSNEDVYKKACSYIEKTSKTNDEGKFFYKCKACGRETTRVYDLRHHIEAKHLDDVSFLCKHCGKILKSRNLLSVHIHRNHKNNQFHI